ncbi:hypothetical protein A3J56_01420 [Candidatus Giovannonibacteria bacterium RIFCSPHIGHO2_02_FULL_46_20]|uniref:Uncharacterized protein n=1 Tax=Candidatus Giovannonibacteria bacterium RIFCSPHIGHO2_02_FULL_46_20 TaxID=1798338 RepID=A0A1F5WGW3_9BACT|nr:MAG: hypothetical protein A3J56_01420 [Candidatus Giovannonibacteria bacterium RIFCSPHIGHO2_02_FULL_46_20]
MYNIFTKTALILMLVVAVLLFSSLPMPAKAIFFGGKVKGFFPCTCGPGYMLIVTPAPGSPSGFYYFGPSVVKWLGSGLPPEWFFSITPGIGMCWMTAGLSCFAIPGFNIAVYGGSYF